MNHPIVENPENPRLWSLHGDIKWIRGIQQLYNRPCYDDITKVVLSLTHALVIGTPGIGNTLYLQIFLVHLFRHAQAEGKDPPSIYYKYPGNGKITVVSFLPDGSVVDLSNVLQPPRPDYLLSDGVDISHPSGKLLNLLVASIDAPSNYNQFQKRIGEPAARRGETIVMPLWSFDELLCIRPDTMSHELAQFRYHVYGGSVRNFMCLEQVRSRVVPVVEDTMNLVFRYAKIDELYPDEWTNIARHISVRLSSKDASTLKSLLQHLLPNLQKIWASKFMELLAGAIFEERSNDVAVELRRLIHLPCEDYLYESLGHRKLLKSQVPFMLKPLLNPLPNEKPVFSSVQFNLSAVLFNTIADITRLPDGTYGLPMTDNFPLVDAIVQPNMLIKFTLSPISHSGSTKNLPEICAGLHEKDLTKVKMVFVIPVDNVATFCGQESLDIPQYICLDDLSGVTTKVKLMTVKEKKLWTQTWHFKMTNGYLLFLKDVKDKWKREKSETSAGTVKSKLAKTWKGLSVEEKEKWKLMAKEQNAKNVAKYEGSIKG